MGLNHSDDAADSFRREDWNPVSDNQSERVWANRHDPKLMVQQFQLFPESQSQFKYEKEIYYFRKNSAYLVAALFLQNQEQGDLCSSTYRQKLFLQTIPIRLSDIEHIPFPDYLHLISQSLRGFQELAREVGYFPVEEEYIGINNNGVVKVWMNEHFEKSTVAGGSNITEQIMVRSLVDLLDRNIDQSQVQNGIPSVRNYLYRNTDSLKFQSAIREFDQFIREYYHAQVPPRLDCIDRVGGISAIANRNRDSPKYIETQVEGRVFGGSNYQQINPNHYQIVSNHYQQIPTNNYQQILSSNYQQPVTYQRPQLIDGEANGHFASSSVRPFPTQGPFVPMSGSQIIRQGQIVEPSMIRQNLEVVRAARVPTVVQVARDSRTSSQRASRIVNQPISPQLVVNPALIHEQRVLQTNPLNQIQNRQFSLRSQVIQQNVVISQSPVVQGRQVHFEQQSPPYLVQQLQPPPIGYVSQSQQVVQTQPNLSGVDSSVLNIQRESQPHIYSSIKSPNVSVNQTSQRNVSVTVNQFNGVVQTNTVNKNDSVRKVSNQRDTPAKQQQPISNIYAFNINNNNEFASNLVNIVNSQRSPIIVQPGERSFNYTSINNSVQNDKSLVHIAQPSPIKLQRPISVQNSPQNSQSQSRSPYTYTVPSYQIPTYQYTNNENQDINLSFNPKVYQSSDAPLQPFKKKQSTSQTTYKTDFSLDDGKSSDEFLKRLREIGSPTALNLPSDYSPVYKSSYNNNQTTVSPIRQQNTYSSVPIARQLNSYETTNNYSYGQTVQYNQQQPSFNQQTQPTYSQQAQTAYNQEFSNSGQTDDEFGRSTVSNIVVGQQSSPSAMNKEVLTSPLKFQQNLDMKYSVVTGEQSQAAKFRYATYSPKFDPELLADINNLAQYS